MQNNMQNIFKIYATKYAKNIIIEYMHDMQNICKEYAKIYAQYEKYLCCKIYSVVILVDSDKVLQI